MKLRLHQFLSKTGWFSSKKALVESIRSGAISVGGVIIVNPEFIFDPSKKRVAFRGRFLERIRRKVCIVMNKPEGYLSSRLSESDRKLGKKSVFSLIGNDKSLDGPIKKSLFCVGRLDECTSGLLLITNDGKLGSAIAKPENSIKKTYLVTLEKAADKSLSILEKGVVIRLEENGLVKSYRTKPCVAEAVSDDMKTVRVVVSEGKKREVRRMFEAVGNTVLKLQRIGIGGLDISRLKLEEGSYIFADEAMLDMILGK